MRPVPPGFALPRYSDLPQVGLYLDQTVQFINGYFRDFPGVELTPSMVSNYVKKGIISHPVKKKYTREQLASLMYIAVSKTVLSLENIDTLFQMQRAHCTAAEAYDYFCDEVENCLPFVFGARNTIRDLAVDATTEKRLLPQHHYGRCQQNVSGLFLRGPAAGRSSLAGYSGDLA